MTTTPKALTNRLREHADIHDIFVPDDAEQKAWADDLREAARIIDSLASAGGVDILCWYDAFNDIVWRTQKDADRARAGGNSVMAMVAHSDHLAALSKEREVADALRAELDAAYEALARIRFALGDNGERMQDELIEWCKSLDDAQSDAERYRAFFDAGLPITFMGVEYHDKPSLDAAIDASIAATGRER